MKVSIFITAMVILAMIGCAPFSHAPTTQTPSPSGKYLVSATINLEKNDKTKYLCVRLVLIRPTGETVTQKQTGASNVHKWALGWMTNQDVIILASSDIGTRAYEVTTNEILSEISITPEIQECATLLKKEKYK